MSPAKTRTSPRKEASLADTTAERLTELANEPILACLVAADSNFFLK